MFLFNESKVFADYADAQYVILNHVTGEYYSFDKPSSSVLLALTSGCSRDDVVQALLQRYGQDCRAGEKVDRLIADLSEQEIVLPGGGTEGDTSSFVKDMETDTLPELGFERFTDVADLLLMDPIHEVDEAMGWPVAKE